MSNTTMVFIPQNGTNVIQAGQVIPGTVIQPPGVIQYVGHQFGSPSHHPQQNCRMGILEKLMKAEVKTLGTIQIIIGLILIGFGAVGVVAVMGYYLPLAAIGGYPFWGGIFIKCSVGFNIVSAIMALVGVILYVIELAINNPYYGYNGEYYTQPVCTGLSVLLLLFTLLEFCITVSIAHFGCQVSCCKNDQATVFVPYMVNGAGAVPAEGNSPPSYNNIAFTPTTEA